MAHTPTGKEASLGDGVYRYERHRPETTLLYQLVEEYYPAFSEHMAMQGRSLPEYVHREFEDYLKCGRLEHGFLRVRCTNCHQEQLVAFSCKHRGFCPSCGARRMADSAALLVDDILPEVPIRQLTPGMACSRAMQEQLPRVLSFPLPLRFLLASQPAIMGKVLGIVYRALSTHQIKKAGFSRKTARTGAVTLIQRFGGALNLNVHLMCRDARMPRAQDAQERPIYCFWMACILGTPTEQHHGFAGSRRPPAMNSHASPTPSPTASAAFWNVRGF